MSLAESQATALDDSDQALAECFDGSVASDLLHAGVSPENDGTNACVNKQWSRFSSGYSSNK